MSDSTTRTTMKRDPYLAPPEVCDWLLSLPWADPVTVRLRSPNGCRPAKFLDCCVASRSVARGEEVILLLRASARKALRKDRDARAAALEKERAALEADELASKAEREQGRVCELEAMRAAVQETDAAPAPPETPADDDAEPALDALNELTGRLLNAIRDADATIPVSIAALEAAKTLFMSQVYDLRQQPEE